MRIPWQCRRIVSTITERLKHHKGEVGLTFASFLIYLGLLFEKLTVFPAYFFCDEALFGVEAYSILTTGADSFGESWPLFFRGFGFYQHLSGHLFTSSVYPAIWPQ